MLRAKRHPIQPSGIYSYWRGESRINEIIGKQNEILDTLSVLHGGMVTAETKMKKWEEKYNSYLKTAQGYADAIKAGCTLYMEGMQTLSALWKSIQPVRSIRKVSLLLSP